MKITDSQQQEINYAKNIEDIMAEKLKHPNSLFDAEALASHISIVTSVSKSTDNKQRRSASNSQSSRGPRGSNMKNSQSGMKESKNESEYQSDAGSSSISKTKTSQFNTETGATGGVYGNIKEGQIQTIDEELPMSMMKAIKIIERLLTQSAYHEQHVLYKNYPPVDNLGVAVDDDEDEKDDNKIGMPFGGNEKKKEEKKEEDPNEAKLEDPDEVTLTHLFQFQCNLTDGRQVSCMDINSANPDLIAVGYGEFDIDCTQ